MPRKLQPRVSILNPEFKYRDSDHTDVRATWRRAQLAAKSSAATKAPTAVVPIRKKGGASC